MVSDMARGRVRAVAGRPQITYDLDPRDVRLQRGIEVLCEIYWAAGAREVIVPSRACRSCATARRGRAPRAAARGRARRWPSTRSAPRARAPTRPPRWWRARARARRRRRTRARRGVVPSSLGVNPQITIMALPAAAFALLARAPDGPRAMAAPAGDAARDRPLRHAVAALTRSPPSRSTSSSSAAASPAPGWRWTRPAAAIAWRWSRSATTPRAPRAVEQARARRAALPAAVRRRARARGAARAPAMVKLAPHLVRPLQMVVPAFDGGHLDRLVGVGLNIYDVDGNSAGRCAAPAAATATARGEPGPPPHHRRRRGRRADPRPGRPPPQLRLPLLRLPDRRRRLVLTVLAEAERFGAVCANRLAVTEVGVADGVRARDAVRRGASSAPTT